MAAFTRSNGVAYATASGDYLSTGPVIARTIIVAETAGVTALTFNFTKGDGSTNSSSSMRIPAGTSIAIPGPFHFPDGFGWECSGGTGSIIVVL